MRGRSLSKVSYPLLARVPLLLSSSKMREPEKKEVPSISKPLRRFVETGFSLHSPFSIGSLTSRKREGLNPLV